ncbi:MAG TPA: T9SS type A sorting domain-containing protein [Ferruginibacter sp.]|nr:T9SS type A sorting domain-containing protein [Ferruginibacter sp.]HMP22403.1 T9SS type A sorting domain-containing protein [Ferruginibacter sp.]
MSTPIKTIQQLTAIVAVTLLGNPALAQQQIIINQGSHLVVNGNAHLVVNNAAFKNNGHFEAGTGTVSIIGTADTAIAHVGGSNSATFYNLTVNKTASGAALKTTATVRNTLTVQGGGTLFTYDNLILKSDAGLTARVAPVNGQINGKTIVERYITARRAWRLLTAPVSDAGTIYNNWQNSGVYEAGVNTFITGPNANSTNGLDASPQNNVSMRRWNTSTQAFDNVTNTKVAISAGNNGSADNTGYYIFIRGDRNAANFNTTSCNATTLKSFGKLQTGDQTFNASGNAGAYTLIGNPYASPVDFSSITRHNVMNRFYVWDPNLNTLGGYVMLDDLANTGTYSKSVMGSSQTKELQSGQAFLVETLSAGPASITFKENDKAVYNNKFVFRPVITQPSQSLNIALNIVQADGSLILADGVLANFNPVFSNAVDRDDALKFININETLAFVRNGTALAAERRPSISIFDTLFLRLWKTTPQQYQFEINTANFAGTHMLLEDKFLGTYTELNPSGTTVVNFSITNQAASADQYRFRIVFTKNTVLPVTISNIKAFAQNGGNTVEWKVENEINIARYEVEKSNDGVQFAKAGVVNATAAGLTYNTYTWFDVTALPGTTFYRIKIYEQSGETKYTTIVKVVSGKTNVSTMNVYPNPVINNTVNIQLNNQPKGNYQLTLVNLKGQVMYSSSISNSSSNSTISLNIPVRLSSGIYQLEINTPDNRKEVQKLVVE